MSKKILIISSSYRKDGNSETLAKEFENGTKEAGNNVEIIYLRDYEIKYCIGCLACQSTGKCVIQDQTEDLIGKVKNADVLVFATPIYYYCISGQLKTFLDRMNPLYGQDYKYREVYLITSAADDDVKEMDISEKEIQGWVSCFDEVEIKGIIHGMGCNDIGDIQKNKELLKIVYDMGKNA